MRMVRGRVLCFASAAALAWADPGMADVESLANDADQLSQLYAEVAQNAPTGVQLRQQLLKKNVDAIGEAHASLSAERRGQSAAAHCSCDRNYAASCPQGWEELSPGSCASLSGYDGPCAAFAHFSSMGPQEKQIYEGQCHVCWPCASPGSAKRRQEGPVRA